MDKTSCKTMTVSLWNLMSVEWRIHDFSISNTFISNTRLKLAKNQAKAKKHLKAELLLFENYSPFSFKNNRRYSKKCTKNKYTCLKEVTWLMTITMRLKMKNGSRRSLSHPEEIWDINFNWGSWWCCKSPLS